MKKRGGAPDLKEFTVWWRLTNSGGGKAGKGECPKWKKHVCKHGALGTRSRQSGICTVKRREVQSNIRLIKGGRGTRMWGCIM